MQRWSCAINSASPDHPWPPPTRYVCYSSSTSLIEICTLFISLVYVHIYFTFLILKRAHKQGRPETKSSYLSLVSKHFFQIPNTHSASRSRASGAEAVWLWTCTATTSGAAMGQREPTACLKRNLDAGVGNRELRIQVEKGKTAMLYSHGS